MMCPWESKACLWVPWPPSWVPDFSLTRKKRTFYLAGVGWEEHTLRAVGLRPRLCPPQNFLTDHYWYLSWAFWVSHLITWWWTLDKQRHLSWFPNVTRVTFICLVYVCCMCTCVCMDAHMCMCACMDAHVCMCVCMNAHMCMCGGQRLWSLSSSVSLHFISWDLVSHRLASLDN